MANWFSEMFGGTPQQVHQAPTMAPEQIKVLQFLMQQGQQGLQNLPQMGDPYAGFAPLAQQARTQFMQQIVPSLSERFTGFTGGALSSPAFASQLGQAGAGLEQNLAALQAQYGLQNRAQMSQERAQQQSQLMQMLGMGLQPQFQNIVTEAQPGLGQEIIPAIGRAGMSALGGLAAGGPAGAGISGFASLLMNLFGGGKGKVSPFSTMQARYQANPNAPLSGQSIF